MSSSHCPQDVYARRMIRADPSRGYPLWFPEPDSNLPEACRTEGLRIGDVGIVTEDGSFDLLFNICSPRDHPLHQLCGVPETFKQVHLPDHEFRDFPFADSPGRAISTQSVNQRNITAGVSGGDLTVAQTSAQLNLEFSSSSAEGAILVLPEGAGKRDFAHLSILREEAQKNGESWHHFARFNRGRTGGDLYLITGHHKASSWSVAAFSDAGSSAGFNATFSAGQVVRGNIAMAYSWQVANPVHCRVGPEQGHSVDKRNQAVSIRGFRIALRQRPFPFFSKRVDVSVQHTGTKFSGSGVFPAPAIPSGSGTRGFGESQHQSSHGASDRGRTNLLSFPYETAPYESPDSEADENAGLHNTSIQLSPSPLRVYHPSDAINRFLLDSEPRANIAVTHDSQWMHVFQKSLPQVGEEELIECIRRCFEVEYDSIGGGSVYLQEQACEDLQNPKDDDKGKNPTKKDDSKEVDTAPQSTWEHAPGFISIFAFVWLVEKIRQRYISSNIFSTQMIVAQPRTSMALITLMDIALFLASSSVHDRLGSVELPSPKDDDRGKNPSKKDGPEGVGTASQSTQEHVPGGASVARSPQAAATSKHFHRLVGILVVQLLLSGLIFASIWPAVEIHQQCIDSSSFLNQTIVTQPRIWTTVVTLVVTGLSCASTFLFTYSAKEVMRHLLRRQMTLVRISTGNALIETSGWKYRKPILTLCTLFVFGVTKLLVISWTTLLVPTLVSCYYDLDGTELSITSPAFSQLLAIELSAYAPTIIHDDSFPIITVGGSVSGISVAGAGFGTPGIIKFNQAMYNISTGGLLPVIESFAGSKIPPGANGTRMQFSGGRTLVNSTISGRGSSSSPRDWLGMQRNFSVYQQGVTADIHCQTADASSQVLNFTNFHTTLNVTSPGSMSPAYKLVAWDSKADCNTSSIATQQYVTWGDASGQPGVAGTGFLPTIVCPGHKDPSDVYSRFVIASQGFYKYNFLPLTICEVTPLITTTRVDYTDGGIINASQILSTQTFSPNDTYLLFYLAGVVNYCARNSQGLTNNIIGDTLYSVHSGEFNTPITNNTDVVYRQLEDYWRGVIEFSATFLRAGYSAQGAFQDGIPSNMTSPLNGTMSTVTMGWANRGPIYIFSILPLGIVTLLTAMAAIYSLSQSRKERHDRGKRTLFDVSDPLHLILASSGDGLASKLSGFDQNSPNDNESLAVKLTELKAHRKNLDS